MYIFFAGYYEFYNGGIDNEKIRKMSIWWNKEKKIGHNGSGVDSDSCKNAIKKFVNNAGVWNNWMEKLKFRKNKIKIKIEK